MRFAFRPFFLLLALWLGGCSSRYFQEAGAPPPAAQPAGLSALPWTGYWTGIVFNGQKIGFSRVELRPAGDGLTEIDSEAVFLLRFMGLEKRIALRSRDWVRNDLTLARLSYDFSMDGSRFAIEGTATDGVLDTVVASGGAETRQQHRPPGPLYPSAAINLVAWLRGLGIGREHRYTVYSGETQTIEEVVQRVEGYEKSELFAGSGWKLKTRLLGHEVATWLDADARPLFELALSGVMIQYLEDEVRARQYLAAASLNKQDSLLDYSLVRPDRAIDEPRRVALLAIEVEGVPAEAFRPDPMQRCDPSGDAVRCRIERPAPPGPGADSGAQAEPRTLASTLQVPARDPRIIDTARTIAGSETDPARRIDLLLAWIEANVRKEPLDVFSALDVLEKRRAECQGHAWLYASFARALGIPTRVVNGLVYSQEYGGFLYHTWAESLAGGRWVAVDPTFGQNAADATHIRLVDGEGLAELTPLLDWIGKVRLRVVEVGY